MNRNAMESAAHLMRYPEATPMQFSGARQFVEQHGSEVWADLCDTVPLDEWFNVTDVARKLGSLARYNDPARYLRAVLKAIIADFADRPEDYEGRAPVRLRGNSMKYASV